VHLLLHTPEFVSPQVTHDANAETNVTSVTIPVNEDREILVRAAQTLRRASRLEFIRTAIRVAVLRPALELEAALLSLPRSGR
jgi:hypothetical protein